jgi:hypothetical protein
MPSRHKVLILSMYASGEEMEYYPSPREELVEEALRKIACDQVKGVYLDDGAGVQFTLYELKKELKERGHDIDKADLVQALKICNLTNIGIQTADGKALMQSAIFPTLLIASREDWLAAPHKAKCYVQFNPLVTACINHITYRQFDYILYMEYKHRLSRWLYKRLAHNYIQAGLLSPYTIKMSTILRDSGTHQSERGANNLREVEKALQELLAKRVLMRYETDILRGQRNKVIDAKYTLHPDMDFINEARKANSRALKLGDMWSQRRTTLVEGRPSNPQTGHSEEQVTQKNRSL